MTLRPRVRMRILASGSKEYYVNGTKVLRLVLQKDGICRLKAGNELLKTFRDFKKAIEEMKSFYKELRKDGWSAI